MTNAHKSKGDRAEREAVQTLIEFCPDLLVDDPMRMLGAGRRDDVGDLRVFDDVAVQVRAYASSNMGAAVRSSAEDAVAQAENARMRFGLGLVPIPNRPRLDVGSVRWVAATITDHWPEAEPECPHYEFGSVSKLTAWLDMKATSARPDLLPVEDRVAVLVTKGCAPIVVGTLQAWISGFRSWCAVRVPADEAA